MPAQEPHERKTNFSSVTLGYTKEQAVKEAGRCLGCKNPRCIAGCPVGVDIPGFIKKIAGQDFAASARILKDKNNLPAICGRVCPQEDQCELKCVLSKTGEPVAIGQLERFVADWEMEKQKAASGKGEAEKSNAPRSLITTYKVAVIGAGPAGLTCAADLAKMGYGVTIFESLHTPGGVLVYGIPEFRLPKSVVKYEVDYVRSLGVEIRTNMVAGKIKTLDDMFSDGYKAVFIGTGAGLPQFLGVPGENLNGIYSANEFLTRVNLMKAYRFPEYKTPVRVGKKVAVIGAGNVAMDSARVALRLGASEVIIVYRRTEKEMPARREEIENAREEGIKFMLLTAPVEFIGDGSGWLKSMRCVRMELGEPDSSGRRRPVAVGGSEFEIETDTAVIAVGQSPNPLFVNTICGIATGVNGNVITDEKTGATNIPGVFSGGDVSTGAATVIQAMGAGKRAAAGIDAYITALKK